MTADYSKNKKQFILPAIYLLSFIISQKPVEAVTQGAPTFNTSQDIEDSTQTFDFTVSNGFDVNFWILPFFTSGTPQTTPFFTVCNELNITLNYEINMGSDLLSLSIYHNSNSSNNGTAYLPKASTTNWINLNLRLVSNKYYNYTLLNGWQGDNWYQLAPSFKILLDSCMNCSESTFKFYQTLSTMGVYWAEMRIYSFDENKPWGVYMSHYKVPSPTAFTYFLANLTIEDYVVYNNLNQGIFSYTYDTNLPVFTPLQCSYFNISMQASGYCDSSCLTNGCDVCQTIDSTYSNTCRYCNPYLQIFTNCIATYSCPVGYYKEHGICYTCPIGCSSCSNYTTCTSCNSGLILRTTAGVNNNITVCGCKDGQYGTVMTSLNTILCASCDQTCKTCVNNSITCTSCSSPLFLSDLYTCISDCAYDMSHLNYYGNTTNQTCQACVQNCSRCTSYYGCTLCQNIDPSIIMYNNGGKCVQKCPSNSINNTALQECYECDAHCKKCDTYRNNCIQCEQDWSLLTLNNTINGTCTQNCPSGWFSNFTHCVYCDYSCILCSAKSYCTSCRSGYYFYGYLCPSTCPLKTYADSVGSYLFCRSCPSGCQQCSSMSQCTICLPGYFLKTTATYVLCVSSTECGAGFYPDDATQTCLPCISNCQQCINGVSCSKCVQNYFVSGSTCVPICPTNTFVASDGTCSNCISNCATCIDSFTCQSCSAGFYLLSGVGTCVASCPSGYYLSSSTCIKCNSVCTSCSTSTICTGCIIGYTLSGSQCLANCGDGFRSPSEECDDGNSVSGDGCSSSCKIEKGYLCQSSNILTTPPGVDYCYCDPNTVEITWSDFWSKIVLTFNSQIYYQSPSDTKSSSPSTFCTQILDTSTLTKLGTNYKCSLSNSQTSSQVVIEVSSDSLLGNNAASFKTSILFQTSKLFVSGCLNKGIPTAYTVQNLPIDTPKIIFQTSIGTNVIPKCQQDLSIDILNSKGLTKRNITVQWTALTLSPSNPTLQSQLQTVLNSFANRRAFTIKLDLIEQLAGISVTFRASVTNFLGTSATNQTIMIFSTSKQISIYDLQDSVTLQIQKSNTFIPTLQLPFCSSDDSSSKASDTLSLSYSCSIALSTTPTVLTSLTSCTIPANYMTLNKQYIVTVSASYPSNSAYNVAKKVIVNPATPSVKIAQIVGCNRIFSTSDPFNLTVLFNTDLTQAQINWYCLDVLTGSTCFSKDYNYISIQSNQTIKMASDQLFDGMTYQFTVVIIDSLSTTYDSASCFMWSASNKNTSVISFEIQSEANKNGYLDFNLLYNSFKISFLKPSLLNLSSLSYNWQISDSSGLYISTSNMKMYQNSVGVKSSALANNNQYKIEVNVTDGYSIGYICAFYKTDPSEISFDFAIEPDTGYALQTDIMLCVSSQQIYEGLYQFIFGYVNPATSTSELTLIPLTILQTQKYVVTVLPTPQIGSSLTCFVQVVKPDGSSRIYYQDIYLNPTQLTVSSFLTTVSGVAMIKLRFGVEIINSLQTLSSQMTIQQKAQVINRFLLGILNTNYVLSDQYIQLSVSMLLYYISTIISSLNQQDSTIVTNTALVFTTMTTTENSQISDGLYNKFLEATSKNLLQFANNMFQTDFQSTLGIANQATIKESIMNGLKNVLKGSMAYSILGNDGGFSFQGQNIYAKAIKFDKIENQYYVKSILPASMPSNLSQTFINFSFPQNSSNPCYGYEACQMTIVILSQPVFSFLSNSKDGELKSLIVDLSIQKTELISPQSQISIDDLTVQNLVSPIQLTIPLYSALNTTNPNSTLGCGYMDSGSKLFKMDGYDYLMINETLVTCYASHLTPIAIQQYTGSVSKKSSDNVTYIKPLVIEQKDVKINLYDSWALWVSLCLLLVMPPLIIWAIKRDKKDFNNYKEIRSDKKKLFINVFLNKKVLSEEEQLRKQQRDNFFNSKIPDPPVSFNPKNKEQTQVINNLEYEKIEMNQDSLRPSSSPFVNSPELNPNGTMRQNPFEIQPIKEEENNQTEPLKEEDLGDQDMIAVDLDDGQRQVKKTKKVVKKKKKKKDMKSSIGFDDTMQQFRQNGFFGGQKGTNVQPVEHDIFFEGGGEEDIQSNNGNKKKKKRAVSRQGSARVKKGEEFKDDQSFKSMRSNRSSKSKGKKKKKKNNGGRSDTEGGIQDLEHSKINLNSSIRSEKKKKRKLKKKRSKSSGGISHSESSNNEHDQEAIVINDAKRYVDTQVDDQLKEDSLQDKKDQAVLDQQINNLKDHVEEEQQQQTILKNNSEFLPNTIKQSQSLTVDQLKKLKKPKKVKEIPAGCCVFCCWAVKESHKFIALYRHFNDYLSRPARVILLIMSLEFEIMLAGLMIDMNQFISSKDDLQEQLVCGVAAAFITKIWSIVLSNLIRHEKEEIPYEQEGTFLAKRLRRKKLINRIRFWTGIALCGVTIVLSVAYVFMLSSKFLSNLIADWAISFLVAFLVDIILLEGLIILTTVFIILIVGASPDSCHGLRNFFLGITLQATKDTVR